MNAFRTDYFFTDSTVLVIRLSRTGRKKVPTYRIVVAEKTAAVKGKYQEIVGHYNPALAVPELVYNKERILYWISQGAQPSETLARVLFRDGVEEMKKFYDANKKFHKKSKKPEEKKEEASTTADRPAEKAKIPAEAPAEEASASVEQKKEEEALAEKEA